MNIKKYALRPICSVLAFSTILSCLWVADAAEVLISESPMENPSGDEADWTVSEGSLEDIEVAYKQTSSYQVTIPKTVALDKGKQALYSIKVAGDIDASERVHVAPVDGIPETEAVDFYMKDQSPDSKKADVIAAVTQNKFYWSSEEVTGGYEETNNSVSAPDLTAGTWKGTFQVAINLETKKSHEHNYVNGVCTECGEKDPNAEHEHNYIDGICDGCGAVDPKHTHNYVDGTCTICGKETDPYETAPANEFRNWKYTLDDENNVITLQQYTNTTAKDVIVYANYEMNGKTYKTQIDNAGYDNTAYYYMFDGKKNIKTIKFSDSLDTSSLTNINRMFYNNSELTSVDFGAGFDTSKVTSMQSVFYGCSSLTNLDLTSFDTSKVTSMYYMFNGCNALTELDLSNFDTRNVTSMENMFYSCSALTDLNVSSFDTSNVTNMKGMFNGCCLLKNLDTSKFNTSKVVNMQSMFSACNSLTNINVSSFDTSNVTDMYGMFSGCMALSDLDVSSFNTEKVTNMGRMFDVCRSLTSLDLSSFSTSSVTNMNGMLRECNALTSVDVSSFDTSNVTDMSSMFQLSNSLTSLDLSSFNTSSVTTMWIMFSGATNLKTINVTRNQWVVNSSCNKTDMFKNCGTSSVTYK